MKKLLPRTKMLDEAKAQSGGYGIFLELLIFFVLFAIANIVQSVLTFIPMLVGVVMNYESLSSYLGQYGSAAVEVSSAEILNILPEWVTASFLFTTVATIVTVFVYCRAIERRKLNTLGFRKKGFFAEYLSGFIIGAIMLSCSLLICTLTGAMQFNGVVANMAIGMISVFLIGYIIQGASEEILLRGYFLVSFSRKNSLAAGIIINSLIFSALHLMNAGITILSVVNLFLFGIFASVYFLKRGNIWGICALHSSWNFVQGNLFGIEVSGMSTTSSVFSVSSVEGYELINGGAFGLEGGLAVTVVLVLATVIMLFTKTKKSELSIEPEQ